MTDLDIAAIRARAEMHAGYLDVETINALCDRITELERINTQLAEALAAERKVKEQMP